MQRIKLKQVDEISRKKIPDAYNSFMRQCRLKNLSPYSYLYYEKNIQFFLGTLPDSKYVDEILPETIENFISMLMDRGNRVIDGGMEYLKRVGEREDWEDLSEFDATE